MTTVFAQNEKNQSELNLLSRALRRSGLALSLSLAALFGMASGALAVPITFQYSGEITLVQAGVSGGPIVAGQSYVATYTFESTTADVTASPNTGNYASAISSYVFDIGSGAYVGSATAGTTASSGDILVLNDSGGIDNYIAAALETDETINGADINGFELFAFTMSLIDGTQTAFADDSLPLTPPPLGGFGVQTFQLSFMNPAGPTAVVQGTVTSFVQVTDMEIPEPGTLSLLLAGLAGLGLMGRRRQPQSAT